jgi:hypothetical protein
MCYMVDTGQASIYYVMVGNSVAGHKKARERRKHPRDWIQL